MSTEGVTGPGASRRRDTVLAAVETFRALDMGINMSNVLVFLYVAENEGISVTELATISGLKKPTASRSVRALTTRGSRWALPPYLGLVELCAQGPARNSKTMWLTQRGRDLCDKLDGLIINPVRIFPPSDVESPDFRKDLTDLAAPHPRRPCRNDAEQPSAASPSAPGAAGGSAYAPLPVSSVRSRAAVS